MIPEVPEYSHRVDLQLMPLVTHSVHSHSLNTNLNIHIFHPINNGSVKAHHHVRVDLAFYCS